ncbi:MAG: TIGR01906 family membrane protein [Chloroflexi bacterium]|nr:TIGR01906 family membrane protein [Chloroflexota bacterium]
MKNLPPPALLGLRTILVAVVPLALALTALRLMLTPLFVQVEYRTPGFPEDSYGFTREDRLRWAPLALEFLLNDEGIGFLGSMRFDDGSAVYNERELAHMQDVKALAQMGLRVWIALVAFLAMIGLWAWRSDSMDNFVQSLARGGQVTILLAITLLVYLALNFNQLFVDFHSVFFEGDSWLFLYSDTLIRLFPIRFWRDAFLVLAGLTLSGAAGLWFLGARQQRP